MKPKPPLLDPDPARTDFQFLEDLATAYWHSEVLFAALDLELFPALASAGATLTDLARELETPPERLARMLVALARLELVFEHQGRWYAHQIANRYLIPGKKDYLGDFLIYRRHMKPGFADLAERIRSGPPVPNEFFAEKEYFERNFKYVQAMDALARIKAAEIVKLLDHRAWSPPVLDVGGGAGALARALIRQKTGAQAVLFELPEVVAAARRLVPDPADWAGMEILEGDFRSHQFSDDRRFGLVILGNFLHAYGPEESKALLYKALDLLTPDGAVLIHDYFPDRPGRRPQKGALYDLHMLANTYNGACHDFRQVKQWLQEHGLNDIRVQDLATDSSVIFARPGAPAAQVRPFPDLRDTALKLGFKRTTWLSTDQIVVGPWPQMKCRFGCAFYGRRLACPPHSPTSKETQHLLESYSRAMLVEGAPPSRSFHFKLLALEKKAFLQGAHKALVFGAGPCPVCGDCQVDRTCRRPDLARPSMEGAGIDVYQTVHQAGWLLKPVKEKNAYVKFIGLLLLE